MLASQVRLRYIITPLELNKDVCQGPDPGPASVRKDG